MGKIKTSYGVALCRYNKLNTVEILLIKKRYTYYYFNFVFGHYKRTDTTQIQHMLNNMSFSEKIDILSLQFGVMWYRIWLNNPNTGFNIKDIYVDKFNYKDCEKLSQSDVYRLYEMKKNRFEQLIAQDGGKCLRDMIINSSSVDAIWEIPKGSQNKNESIVDCAIREFHEETAIDVNRIKLFHDQEPIIESYVDDGINYKNIYFLARLRTRDKRIQPKIRYDAFEQIKEVENIRWVSLNEIKFLHLNKRTYKKTVDLYKRVIKKFKNANRIQKLNFIL